MRGKWEGKLNYTNTVNSINNESDNIVQNLYEITSIEKIDELYEHFKNIIITNDSGKFEDFIKKIISYVNQHKECLWILIGLDSYIHELYMELDNQQYEDEYQNEVDNILKSVDFIEKICKKMLPQLVRQYFKIDYEKEFLLYYKNESINSGWNSCDWPWSRNKGSKETTFPELVMEISGLKWSDDDEEFEKNWNWEKYHHYATTCLWLSMMDFYHRMERDNPTEMATCLWSVFDEAYEPIRDSGYGPHWEIVELILRKILFIEIDEFNTDENPKDRDDLNSWNEYIWDMEKICQEAEYKEYGDDWAPKSWEE